VKISREEILDRASLAGYMPSTDELNNAFVDANNRINNGLHRFDALDFAYFHFKSLKNNQ
jgi:hypothetical protein